MYKFILTAVISLMAFASTSAQTFLSGYSQESSNHSATMSFVNRSEYTLTVKIMNYYGGCYRTVVLSPHSSQSVSFGSSATYSTKIKAKLRSSVSYHRGGEFSVTCSSQGYSEGEISFYMSTYGNGLGPSISAAEFASDN